MRPPVKIGKNIFQMVWVSYEEFCLRDPILASLCNKKYGDPVFNIINEEGNIIYGCINEMLADKIMDRYRSYQGAEIGDNIGEYSFEELLRSHIIEKGEPVQENKQRRLAEPEWYYNILDKSKKLRYCNSDIVDLRASNSLVYIEMEKGMSYCVSPDAKVFNLFVPPKISFDGMEMEIPENAKVIIDFGKKMVSFVA